VLSAISGRVNTIKLIACAIHGLIHALVIRTDPSQALHQLFLPPLLEKFYAAINPSQSPLMSQSITSGDIVLNPYVFPIMECITSVYPAVGGEIAPYSHEIVKTCLYIAQAVLDAYRNFMNDEESPEPPSKDFLVCCLDVISGVVEGLGGGFAEIVLGIDISRGEQCEMLTVLFQQLVECMQDESNDGTTPLLMHTKHL
jgi:hypothetical protein